MSDKSRKGKAGKNIKENSESPGSLSDEVFSDGLNSPECAKVVVQFLRNIENLVKELLVWNEETKNAQIKVTESLNFFQISLMNLREKTKRKAKV